VRVRAALLGPAFLGSVALLSGCRALEAGRHARSVGKQFLTVYAAARKKAFGSAPTTLPASF